MLHQDDFLRDVTIRNCLLLRSYEAPPTQPIAGRGEICWPDFVFVGGGPRFTLHNSFARREETPPLFSITERKRLRETVSWDRTLISPPERLCRPSTNGTLGTLRSDRAHKNQKKKNQHAPPQHEIIISTWLIKISPTARTCSWS